jgi:oxazoline/thiazoline dehydrogenase
LSYREEWAPHDREFHSRTRWGIREPPDAVINQVIERPLPAIKPPMSSERITLERDPLLPAIDLAAALSARRSVIGFSPEPPSLVEVGALLYHAARVQHTIAHGRHGQPYEASLRPYPSGGACHPLEIYLAVASCRGLTTGFHHYDPGDHALDHLAEAGHVVDRIIRSYSQFETTEPPPILVVITARFARTMQRYREIGYAMILKESGALMQNLYLVATALGLAPCALGSGDSAMIAEAIGSDFFEESSVAEMALGKR